MADTKKEHYVPRCYLKNFIIENDRIHVFDKFKLQSREQRIMDVAMENYFYDIDFETIIDNQEDEAKNKIKSELLNLFETDKWEDVEEVVRDKKHIEKGFFGRVESTYGSLLSKIISNSYGGNQWVMNNCFFISEEGKSFFSLLVAIQIIRTKSFRSTVSETFEKFVETLSYKSQMHNTNALTRDDFKVSVNEDYAKLLHSGMILDEEMAVDFAKVLSNHIWVMYVNKTEYPFYTSDNPVVNIPHKKDEFLSFSGLNSEGVEIVFPLTPNLLLAMYERSFFENEYNDREYISITTEEEVNYFNYAQVINSYRCVFSGRDNFEYASDLCEKNPKLQKVQSRIVVG